MAELVTKKRRKSAKIALKQTFVKKKLKKLLKILKIFEKLVAF